jgi:tetratricopeptide (TPR) repeat protein
VHTSDFEERERVIGRSLEIAREAGDDREEAWAVVHRIVLHRSTAPASWVAEAHRYLPEAIRVLEAAGDEGGLAAAWHTVALAAWPDNAAASTASEHAVRHGRRANDPQVLGWALLGRVTALLNDDTPVADAIPIVQGIADETRQLGRLFHAGVGGDLAVLVAMAGRYDDACGLIEAARATLREFNHGLDLSETATRLMIVHELGGHLERAEAALRESTDFLEAAGDQDLGPYHTAMLARCLARQGRSDEAAALITKARVNDADPIREIFCLSARSHILAAEGDSIAAVEEAQRAVEGVQSKSTTRRGLFLLDLASVLRTAGRVEEARTALGEAREVGERKGNVALVALVDGELERLREPIRPSH